MPIMSIMSLTNATAPAAARGVQSLPPELLLEVMSLLDLNSVAKLACTCRSFANRALLSKHSDYALVLALFTRNVKLFCDILAREYPRTFLPRPQVDCETFPHVSLFQTVRACVWILAAHLNESAPHFWAPLSAVARALTCSSSFALRLVTTAVTRHHAAGLSAFANFHLSTQYCCSMLLNDHPWLDFGQPIPAIATAPPHIRSQLQLALFKLAHPICSRVHSSRNMALAPSDKTCAFHKLASSNDLSVIVPGLLFLDETTALDQVWFDHFDSGNGRSAVPAIACLVSELVRHGHKDLFDLLMRFWVLVIAGGIEGYLGGQEPVFPCTIGSNARSPGQNTFMPLERPTVHFCGRWFEDCYDQISAQLSLHGIPDAQVNQLYRHFQKHVCSINLHWILGADMSYLWANPQVLDAWIEWLLTHTLVSVPTALLLAYHLPTLIVHVQPSTLLLILDRVPLRSHLGSPVSQRPTPTTFSGTVQPIVSPYPLIHTMVAAHKQSLQVTFDRDAKTHPSWITRSDAQYWSCHLPLVEAKHYMTLWAWGFARATSGPVPDWEPISDLPFVLIVDTLIHRGWFVDSALLSLPLELLDLIVPHLDLKSLAHFACTCRFLAEYPHVLQQPDYALLTALSRKDLPRFRTLIAQNKYRDLAQGLLSNGTSFSRRGQVLVACIWILVAHLNESSLQFWIPLSHLLCVHTRFLDGEFFTRLATVVVHRHHAVGLRAFAKWMWQNNRRHLEISGIGEILLRLSNSTTRPALPSHVKADMQLALFRLAQTSCLSHSHHERHVPTCALHLLAATEDLGVIIQGLLFLQQQQQISEKVFWFKHAVTDDDQAVPAIHCLLAELLSRGRYDLFQDLLDIWMLVLARGSSNKRTIRDLVHQANGAGYEESDSDSDDDWELNAWIRSCDLDRIEIPKIQLGGTPMYDYRSSVVSRLAIHGVSEKQANGVFQLFKRYVCPLELDWILDSDYFWSVPRVLDGWIKWLLTHLQFTVAKTGVISRSFPEIAQHLSHDSIALILERVPIRSLIVDPDSPGDNLTSLSASQLYDPWVYPCSISSNAALAHANKVRIALDSDIRSFPVRVSIPEPAYWTSTLAIFVRKCPQQLAPICRYTLACMRNPDVIPANTIDFATIMDAMIQGGQFVDALAALQEVQDFEVPATGGHGWRLSREKCALLQAGGVGRPKGMKEWLAFVHDHKLVEEPEAKSFLLLLDEFGLQRPGL
ncbi:hypothetical protein BCR44DRAFT_28076 [Catenaria anguillulae PL171]|uniref:F-box domain-containing protein n=1 Tax=Catenaria anguillulae PL171 TaxID=765915 RepID=A0A1Y2HGQ9_9FUNG|nr:hypothetical protein BCR44DRAFT_28076 [Catenaria anguillulae PL171]